MRSEQASVSLKELGLSHGSYLEVKDTNLHSVRGLAVGQEGLVVKDAAHGTVRGRRFGLGGQWWSIWINGPVQISDLTGEVKSDPKILYFFILINYKTTIKLDRETKCIQR